MLLTDMIKKLLNLTTVLVLAAAAKTDAQTSQRITEVNTIADLLARKPVYSTSNVESVSVRGFTTQGDWGQPKVFRYDSTNALTTNAIRRATVTGVGRWVHDWDGDARAFGYKGDGVTDDTTAAQAAIDAGWAYRKEVKFPSGDAIINSVTMGQQAISGEWTARQGYGSEYKGGTMWIHKSGATNHMIRMRGGTGAVRGALIRNMQLQGRSSNVPGKKTILSSTNRLAFTVATNDLPSNGGSTASWPYYGHVFFYTSESKYVGYGIASNINATTGVVTLLQDYDHYATLASSDYLSANWSVVFSPSVTVYDDRGVAITAIDPSAGGYAGISMESESPSTQSVMNPDIQDVYIRGFQTGIRSSVALAPHLTHCWINANTWFNICAPIGGYSYDWNLTQTFIQGFYSDWDANSSPETLTLKNKAFRYTAFGIYGLDTTGMLGDITADHCVNGVYLHHGADTHIPALHIDAALGSAITINASRFGNRVHFSLPDVTVRTWSTYDTTNFGRPYAADRKSYVLRVMANNGGSYPPQVQIGNMNTTLASDATNNYTALFHSDTSSARIQIRGLFITNGISLFNSTNTLYEYETGLETQQVPTTGGLIWNGVAGSYVTSTTTNVLINTNDFTVWLKVRIPVTAPTNSVRSMFALSSSATTGGAAGGLYSGLSSSGNLLTTLHASSSSHGRTATIASFQSTFAGQLVDMYFRRASGTFTINVNGKNRSYTESTFGASPPSSFAAGVTNYFSLVGIGDQNWIERIYRFAVWNRALADSELPTVSVYGIPISDRWGSNAVPGCIQDLNLGIGTGTNIVDRSANGFNGNMVGTNVFHIQ